jgi:hypothetical protein
MSEDNSNDLRDELVDDKVSDEEIADLDEAKEVAKGAGVDEVEKAANAAPKAKPLPKTKAGMLKAAYDKMHEMNKDDLKKAVEKMMYDEMYEAKEVEEEDDEDMEDGESDMSKANEKKMKKANEKKKKDHSDMKEDIQALVDSEATLSEGFKEKAETIFEAALNARVGERVEELEESYQQELTEETDRIQSELVEKVDGYLNYVVENWMEDNKLAIENGLRSEIAESFMGALKGVFQEHYVEVPESKTDIVDELANKVDKLEEELNDSVTRAMSEKKKVQELTREKIVNEASSDLTLTQADKLRGLTEGVDFEDEDTFEKKVATLKESYFGETDNSSTSTMFEETSIDSDTAEEKKEELSGPMARYVEALNRSKK